MFQEFDLPMSAIKRTLSFIPDDELLRDAFAGYTSYDGTIDHCQLVEKDGEVFLRISVPMHKTRSGWQTTSISGEIQDLLMLDGEPVKELV